MTILQNNILFLSDLTDLSDSLAVKKSIVVVSVDKIRIGNGTTELGIITSNEISWKSKEMVTFKIVHQSELILRNQKVKIYATNRL